MESKLLKPIVPDHPIWPMPTRELFDKIMSEHGAAGWNKLIAARNARIKAAKIDPLRKGYKLPSWQRIWKLLEEYSTVVVLGGNRSSKSEFAGDTIARAMTEGRFWDSNKNRNEPVSAACMFSAQRPSWTLQQPYVYKHLPPEIRDSGRKQGGDVSFRRGRGFINDMFIMPSGSQTMFWFYEQDPDTIEGQGYDIVWLDELLKGPWIEVMKARTADTNGRLLITVTLIHGMILPVKEIMTTCKIVETAAVNPKLFDEDVSNMTLARDCPNGHVPVLMTDEKLRRCVYFLQSEDNPFLDKQGLLDMLAGLPRDKRLIRAYGYCDYTATVAFAKFSERVHVLSVKRIQQIAADYRYTLYCSADPGGGKPWFIKWYAAFENKWKICLWEYPDYGSYGAWAKPPERDEKQPRWTKGEAQSANPGAGFLKMKEVIGNVERNILNKILGVEKTPEIFARYIDPRMGAAIQPSENEAGTSFIELMREIQFDKNGNISGESIFFEPAHSGAPDGGRLAIESSIALINDQLDYDADKPISPDNCPKFYICEECWQSRMSYKNFSVNSHRECALKDPIDDDRYFLNMGPEYVSPEDLTAVQFKEFS